MLTKLQHNKYIIAQIINESDSINHYTAQNTANHRFCVSEIKDVKLIEKFLQSDMPKGMENAELSMHFDIFTENKCLYIVTPYSEGESLATYIKYRGYNTLKKITLLKAVTFKFANLSDSPEILRGNVLMPENVSVVSDIIGFNYFIFSAESQNYYLLFSELVKNCFSIKEIDKSAYLGIILRKLEHGLYNNFAEVYIDLKELERITITALPFVQKVKTVITERKWMLKIAFAAFVTVVTLITLFKMAESAGDKIAGDEYNPVKRIGTVMIDT